MGVYIASTIAIVCCILTVFMCRRYVQRTFNSIDGVLDKIVSKDLNSLYEISGESRVSKLTHKARRVVDMCVSEVAENKQEKKTIQGFISDMSHQMKTPLSGIAMYTDLLLEGKLSGSEEAEFLSRMKSSTEKLQWILESLIKMSRLEVGTIQIMPLEINIKQTMSEAIGSVIGLAVMKNINISVLNFEDMILYHDKKWTQEAIINVLENAVKYSPCDSEIKVSIEPLPLYTKVIITDHGVGIKKEDWNLIFKRFYRGQNVNDKEGAGLGESVFSTV